MCLIAHQVAIAEPLAKPGETVVSPTVQNILGALVSNKRRLGTKTRVSFLFSVFGLKVPMLYRCFLMC